MTLSLFGIALMPVIMALVDLLKKVGMPTAAAPYVTGILSAGFFYLTQYIEWHPELAPQVELWLNVLVIFLGASGFYAVKKYAVKRLSRG